MGKSTKGTLTIDTSGTEEDEDAISDFDPERLNNLCHVRMGLLQAVKDAERNENSQLALTISDIVYIVNSAIAIISGNESYFQQQRPPKTRATRLFSEDAENRLATLKKSLGAAKNKKDPDHASNILYEAIMKIYGSTIDKENDMNGPNTPKGPLKRRPFKHN